MGLPKKNIPGRKHRLIAVVLMAAAAFTIGCSSADAPERATRIPRSPAPPTSDLGATVDALVQQRLSEAKTIRPRTPVTIGPTAGPSAEPSTTAPATTTITPEDPTPVGETNDATATPAPTPTVGPTASATATPTLVPTSTPTFDDDHGDSTAYATSITFEESPTVLTGEIDVLDDIDYFAISNTVPGKTWVFTPEYLPPETESGRFPTIAIIGSSVVPDIFTGVISFQPRDGTIFLSVTSERFERLGDYRVVVDRTGN